MDSSSTGSLGAIERENCLVSRDGWGSVHSGCVLSTKLCSRAQGSFGLAIACGDCESRSIHSKASIVSRLTMWSKRRFLFVASKSQMVLSFEEC